MTWFECIQSSQVKLSCSYHLPRNESVQLRECRPLGQKYIMNSLVIRLKKFVCSVTAPGPTSYVVDSSFRLQKSERLGWPFRPQIARRYAGRHRAEIGRASCRERV